MINWIHVVSYIMCIYKVFGSITFIQTYLLTYTLCVPIYWPVWKLGRYFWTSSYHKWAKRSM